MKFCRTEISCIYAFPDGWWQLHEARPGHLAVALDRSTAAGARDCSLRVLGRVEVFLYVLYIYFVIVMVSSFNKGSLFYLELVLSSISLFSDFCLMLNYDL